MWRNKLKAVRSSGQSRGFVLVEIMMVMFIFLLLAGVMFAILATGRNAWQIGDARIQIQQELRKAMEIIQEELRQASPSTIVGVPADGAWHTAITFQVPLNMQGAIIRWSNSIQFVLGGLDNRQILSLSLEPSWNRVIANNITYLGFRRQTATPFIVEVSLQADKNTIRGTLLQGSLDFQVNLRN